MEVKGKIDNIVDLNKVKIFCSTSPRASITADNLFPKGADIRESDQLIEFDLSILYVPFLKCGIRTWFLISRITWFIGFLKTNRNLKQERERTDSCVELLITEALTADVALVAYGLLHLFIEKQFKKMGWSKSHSFSNGCFSIKIFQKCN